MFIFTLPKSLEVYEDEIIILNVLHNQTAQLQSIFTKNKIKATQPHYYKKQFTVYTKILKHIKKQF